MLRGCNGRGGMEAWIAGQPWQAAGDGWVVLDNLQSWVFQVAPVLGGRNRAHGTHRQPVAAVSRAASSSIAPTAFPRNAVQDSGADATPEVARPRLARLEQASAAIAGRRLRP